MTRDIGFIRLSSILSLRYLLLMIFLFGSTESGYKLVAQNSETSSLEAIAELYRKNPRKRTYALRYGQALIEHKEYQRVVTELRTAAKREPELHRILAQAYFHSYFFSEARQEEDAYIAFLKKQKKPIEDALHFLDKIDRAAAMMEQVARVEVIDSLVIPARELINAYSRLSPEAGRILSGADMNGTDRYITAHIDARNQRAVAGARRAGRGGTELVELRKIGSRWEEVRSQENLNKTGTENYPGMKQDGSTLFFCREDNERGLGGMDIYMTRRNASGELFLDPTLLGMPYNSIYNDYLLVYDEGRGVGYFASDRYQPQGWVCIYTFLLDDINTQLPTDDLDRKRTQATLRCIAATQEIGTDYTEKLKSRTVDTADAHVEEVNLLVEGRRYRYWTDFRSSKGAELYRQMLDRKDKLELVLKELGRMRSVYRQNPNRRVGLRDRIYSFEEQELSLRREIAQLKQDCLAAELSRKGGE
ncbi:Uncharacterised protein [Porphyromonas crevioricanis]|uniref:Uncharacterized protein n=1 Tax=Porphyromonas crevioricanis TaxID=393921 RepID=A0A2X4PQF2_9PORP|nr:hypothetical protein [Porphyromonas crevioricanis]GAD08160.1 hypothetical protein PORCAN_1796 [Porphyromonas crevioricanis JCM 13913]SQH73748.1 Uncharacterised protein [Porphyromonas crevioricanis]